MYIIESNRTIRPITVVKKIIQLCRVIQWMMLLNSFLLMMRMWNKSF